MVLVKGEIAGLLPVVSWVLGCKWLIINGVSFSGNGVLLANTAVVACG